MRIAGIVQESVTDGPGIRTTVFVQGCHRHCKDCHNPQTHDLNGGREESVDIIMSKLHPNLKALTISGGEPLLQASECLKLVEESKKRGINIWLYTGYRYEDIEATGTKEQKELIHKVDVLVDGPFIVEDRTMALRFRGSKNQRCIDMRKTSPDHVVEWEG